MLPAVTRTLIAATAALSLTAASVAPANAWGKNEQNFLKGILATVAVGTVIYQVQKQPRQVTRAPVYQQPAYQPVYQQPVRQPTYTPAYGAPRSAASLAFADYSPAMRRAIQRNLAAYGYYAGSIDGAWGPRTSAAVRMYADDAGLSGNLTSYGGAVRVLDGLAV
jgi:hypothetical protein